MGASTLPSQCILSRPEKVKSEKSGLQQPAAAQATRPTPAPCLQQDLQQAQLSSSDSSAQNQSPDKPNPIRKNEAPHPSLPSKNPIQPPKFELKDLRKVETKTEAVADGQSPGSPVKRASSFKGSFDFTKTPSAFLASKSNIPRFATSVSEGFKQAGEGNGQTGGGLQKSREVAQQQQQSSDSRNAKKGETGEKKCDPQSPTCESSASKFPLSRTDITLEERPAVTSARVGGVIPASCPPKRRSLIQENMNEEAMKEDIKKGPMKEKLLVPEFEGRDKSERNANVEQRLY